MKLFRFERQGILAIEPRALFQAMPEPPKRSNRTLDTCVVVEICGPLDHHIGDGFCDSYEGIGQRFTEALASDRDTIVLSIDSPGGLVSGCFELARSMRSQAKSAGKRLVTYVNGQACSAAYALACASEKIYVPETGTVGSIGVIATRLDVTALDAAMGTKVATITSGERKSDGNPHVPMSESELVESQKNVDALAAVFFGLVSDMRGKPAAAIEALQARVVFGSQAVSAGLADAVTSFDGMLALLASPARGAMMATKYEEARAALAEAAKGDDEEAKKAQRALAAMDGEDNDDEEKGDDEEASAESGDDEEKQDDDVEKVDGKAAATAAISANTSAHLAATVSEQGKEIKRLAKALDASEREKLLASRPDLDKALLAVLKNKPFAEVKAIVGAIAKTARANPAAAAVVPATRGSEVAGKVVASATDETRAMDLRMGVSTLVMGVKREQNAMVFGAMTAEEAAQSAGKEGAK